MVKVKLNNLNLSNNSFTSNGESWDIPTLIQYCKEQKYEVFEMPLAGINLSVMPFIINDIDDFIWHSNRVRETSLDYPIILDNKGYIADGYHRIIKAILQERETIKTIRIEIMPNSSSKVDKTIK